MKSIQVISPIQQQVIASYDVFSEKQIEDALTRSFSAFQKYSQDSLESRIAILRKLSSLLLRDKAALALLMAQEMGKPLEQGIAEIEKSASACDYFADQAPEFLKDRAVQSAYSQSQICFRAIGPILTIMPWNFPFWQTLRFLAPSLAAGNTVLLKHANQVQGCAHKIAALVEEAAPGRDLLKNLVVEHEQIPALINDHRVRGVTFTGSTQAGRSVGQLAGGALKKCVLELGGSDAYIIAADADLDQAAKICAKARLVNSGQSCVAAKRFIVEREVASAFSEKFRSALSAFKLGDPTAAGTQLGPVSSLKIHKELLSQVKKSVEMGAKLLLGDPPSESKDCYFPVTMLSGVKPGMPAFQEETFGPVAAVIECASLEEGLAIANNSVFGLGGAIFSKNEKRALELAKNHLEVGFAVVNEQVKSDPRLPFGGLKDSGFGRELSQFGLYEFCNVKTVALQH